MPSQHEMMVFQTMAKSAVESKMYKGIGDQAGVMMVMLAARELGIPPMQALNGGINLINGKAEISARMMSALIRKAGHTIAVKDSTDISCTLVGKRKDTGETLAASFSVADAQKAGLIKPSGGWVKCPKDMCFARALSRLARQLFSDVIGIGYVEGEIKASEAVVSVPNDIPLLDEQSPAVKAKNKSDLLSKFKQEDHDILLKYIHVVRKHFGWSEEECITKFSSDEKLYDKFNQWKAKNAA